MAQPLAIPTLKIIGKEIKLGEKVGSGSNGDVYVARPLPTAKSFAFPSRFAVKVIRQDLCCAEFLQAVERELETGRELRHPFIVQYIGSWVELQRGTHAGCYCLALHYCDGGDMHTLITSFIQKREFAPSSLVVLLMAHVFSALNYSHSKKIIHRDIKPANIFLVRGTSSSRSGTIEAAMVGDYGLARPLEQTVQAVATRVGTPCYCSPEIVAGEAYTVKTDIFSAGAMFYELMMLERAFWKRGYNDRQTFYDILNRDPTPHLMKQCAGRYDDGLVRVVAMCLAKHEKDRPSAYQVLSGICASLQSFVARHHIPVVQEPIAALSQPPPATQPTPKVSTPAAAGPAKPDDNQALYYSAAVPRLLRRFRDVVPHAHDDAVLDLLDDDIETFLLLKVLTATRAKDPERLRSGLYGILRSVTRPLAEDDIVSLLFTATPT